MNQDLSTLPSNILGAANLKDWLKVNNVTDYLSDVKSGFYEAAINHDAQGNTVAMQANADIIVGYQKEAYANSK